MIAPSASPNQNSARLTAAPSVSQYFPAYFALPGRSGGDPVCGMGRSWWLDSERDGLIKLYRVKRRGNVRAGRVLIKTADALALIERLNAGSVAKGGAS